MIQARGRWGILLLLLAVPPAIPLSGCSHHRRHPLATVPPQKILVKIDVQPGAPSLIVGLEQKFTAMGTFNDNSQKDITETVAWTSSDATIAPVGNDAGKKGIASDLGTGSVTVTATQEGVIGTAPLTITQADLVSIAITPADPSVSLGSGIQF